VSRLIPSSPPRSRKHKCARALPPSARGRPSHWTPNVPLVCSHYREPVPRAILDGVDVAKYVCVTIRWVMRLRISPIPPLQRPSIVNFAFYQLLDNGSSRTSATRAVAILIFAAVVIRAELAALLGSIALQLLLDSRISSYPSDQSWPLLQSSSRWYVTFLSACDLHAFTTLTDVTVLIDSYFWDQWPLWPELFSIYFNVYEGKSAEWGAQCLLRPVIAPSHTLLQVSPFWTYITTLPRLLMATTLFIPIGFIQDGRIRSLV
jgi:hypothetical protein